MSAGFWSQLSLWTVEPLEKADSEEHLEKAESEENLEEADSE